MAKVKRILGLLLLSVIGASSTVVYSVRTAKRQLQEEKGYSKDEAIARLLEMRNEEIAKKKQSMKNSRSILQWVKSAFSLVFIESEKILLD